MKDTHGDGYQQKSINLDQLQRRAQSRRSLPAEESMPLAQRLERCLADGVLWALLQALRERQGAEGGRIFTICFNLHSERVSCERAMAAHSEGISSLAKYLWDRFNRKKGVPGDHSRNHSYLSPAAKGCRPLSVFTPGKAADGCFHTHGILYVPETVGNRVQEEQLLAFLSEFRGDGVASRLHKSAVHISPITPLDDPWQPGCYMRTNLSSLDSHDRTLMLAPYGRNVAEDWADISRRVDGLVHELGKQEQLLGNRRAVRKNRLVQDAWDGMRRSSPVKTGRPVGVLAPPGSVPVPQKPAEPPRLPSAERTTEMVEWDGSANRGRRFPKKGAKQRHESTHRMRRELPNVSSPRNFRSQRTSAPTPTPRGAG